MREKSPSAASAAILSTPRANADALATYCPDLEQWPNTWRYEARDLAPGRQMVEIFRPFLRHLWGMNQSDKTLRKHRDNLWASSLFDVGRNVRPLPREGWPPT